MTLDSKVQVSVTSFWYGHSNFSLRTYLPNIMQVGFLIYKVCSRQIHYTYKQNLDIGLKGQGHSELILVHNTLHCPNTYMDQYKQKSNNLTMDSKVKVTLTSFWYTTLYLVRMQKCTNINVVRLKSKYFTLDSKVKVTVTSFWYMS